jgi:hypothetical protein
MQEVLFTDDARLKRETPALPGRRFMYVGSHAMTKDIEQAAEAVNPVRRDKLARLGDKLDAAEKHRDDDEWVGLFFEYEALAIKLALKTRPPKITIKSTAAYWQADAMVTTLYHRMKAIQADIESNSGGNRTMRTAADLKASLALTKRDWMIFHAAIRKYQDDKKRRKEFWRTMRKAERKTVISAGLSFPVVAQFGRRS